MVAETPAAHPRVPNDVSVRLASTPSRDRVHGFLSLSFGMRLQSLDTAVPSSGTSAITALAAVSQARATQLFYHRRGHFGHTTHGCPEQHNPVQLVGILLNLGL